MESYTFRLKKIGTTVAFDKGLLLDPHRFKTELIEVEGKAMMRALVDILVQDEELTQYPATWWEAVKERWFPAWLKKKCPVQYKTVWAEHRFPELDSPLGAREFVTIKVVKDAEELRKLRGSTERTT